MSPAACRPACSGSRHPSTLATTSATFVHLAGTVPDEDPVRFFRTETAGLLNALDAARTWGARRFAVASSLGMYIGRTETPWHEELALPAAELPHLIVAFKKAVEPLTTQPPWREARTG